MARVCVAVTCKNAELTIGYALLSALKQIGIDKLFAIVDAASTDSTRDVVEYILSRHGVEYKLVSEECTIPEGRNKLIKMALDLDADYVMFLDADTLMKYSNLVSLGVRISRGRYVVHFPYELKFFTRINDLESFCKKTIESMGWLDIDLLKLRKSKWCGLGATLIPRSVAESIEIDRDLSFCEDRFFGFACWDKEFPIVTLGDVRPCVDVNLVKGMSFNIYTRMGVKEYLRGLSKKVLWCEVWNSFEGSLMKTLRKFVRSKQFARYAFHLLLDALSIAASIYLTSILVGIPLGYLIAMVIGSTILMIKKGMSLQQAVKSFIKFNTYSVASITLFIPLYLRYSELLRKAFNAYAAFEYSEGINWRSADTSN